VKWHYLYEADETARDLYRKWLNSGAPGDLYSYLKNMCRSGQAASLCTKRTEPRTAAQWTKFARIYGATLSHTPGAGDRHFDLVFPIVELREFFAQYTRQLHWLNWVIHRNLDRPQHYTISLTTNRGIRGPTLNRVKFEEGTLDLDDPLMQGTQYYNPPRYIEYRSGKRQRHIVKSGTNDHTALYRFTGSRNVLFYTENFHMPYVGLTEYEDGEQLDEIFLQGEHRIIEVVGPRELDLPETQIVRRLYRHMG